jgi:4-hydroxymandelate oxidase
MKLINLFDYEQSAREVMPAAYFDYYAGGAGDELTLRQNRLAFDRLFLRPRVLVDVSQRSLCTTLLGRAVAMPLIIAPTAMACLAHPEGEIAIARAAQESGIVNCLSTLSTKSLEEVAAATAPEKSASLGAMNWFQLYVYRDRDLSERLLERAILAGYQAIVLTVDVAMRGLREGSLRLGLRLPPGLTMKNFDGLHTTAGVDVMAYVSEQFDPSLTWDDLKWIISRSPVPVLVKGILREDDARRAVDCGAQGVIVSNHGGRQLDTAMSALEALPEVAAAVGQQAAVYIDGGVRRGTDILKALALGAEAVMVGRPVLWGLAVGGQQGVERVLEVLRCELDMALALCGCPSIDAVTPDLLAPST